MASIAELTDTMARIEAAMEENERRRAEYEKKLAEELAEHKKKLDEERVEREKKLDEERVEREKSMAESWKDLMRAIAKTEAERAKTEAEHAKTERMMQRLEKNMGGLNNSIGEIVEMIVIPGVMDKMNGFEHNFTIASPRWVYYNPADMSKLTEVDLLLENGTEVMAVEVKTQVSKKWVERHLKRLEILRKREHMTGMKGRVIYAAIAGVSFDADARELAVENGMYLIEINEDTERITIKPPEKARTW